MRYAYTIDDFLVLEHSSPLAKIFDYWCSLDGAVPAGWQLKSHAPELVPFISTTATVIGDDPLQFVISDHRVCEVTNSGSEWNGRQLRALPEWRQHATHCAIEYLECRESGVPQFHRIASTHPICRDYVRLLLPVADRNGTVTTLYSATRRLQENKIMGAES